jgi:hypothetical protein
MRQMLCLLGFSTECRGILEPAHGLCENNVGYKRGTISGGEFNCRDEKVMKSITSIYESDQH